MTEKLHFSPSSVSKCQRQLYYKGIAEPITNDVPIHSSVKMDFGNALHDKIQNILKQEGIYAEGEELKHINYMGLDFYYRVDGIVEINKQKYILEIKTTYGKGNHTQKEWDEEHLIQTLFYMEFEGLKNAVLLYVARDNAYMMEYEIKITNGRLYIEHNDVGNVQDIMTQAISRLARIKENIIAKEIPSRDYKIVCKKGSEGLSFDFQKDNEKYKSDWQCTYCRYLDKCWSKEINDLLLSDRRYFINGQYI